MTTLSPDKLHVKFKGITKEQPLSLPRKYTLTHSDSTGDLFLTIADEYDYEKISGFYTRLMRDEVLAEWEEKKGEFELHLYLHVSGGICFGWAGLRDKIFRYHLPLVLEAIKFSEKDLFQNSPEIEKSKIIVHFQSKKEKYNKIENIGSFKDI
jgi:hypothetical protein